MGLKTADIIATLIFNLLHSAYAADHILSCNVTALEPCTGSNQICSQTSNECECLSGYRMVSGECVLPDDGDTSSHTTTALVTIFTLGLLSCGLFLVLRKYDLLEYMRQHVNFRRNNDVMYEDVMIGQDDPPLSP